MSSSSDLVTVVIPAFNAAQFVSATLQSVLSQTYANFEVVVVDDCSADETVNIVRSFGERDPRIKLISLEQNRGAPAAPRNIGVAAAKGRWIAFLDADDIWHPDKLRCQVEALQRTGAKFCSTRMIDFSEDRDLSFDPPGDYNINTVSFLAQLLRYRTPTSSVVVDVEVIRDNPFNEDIRYKAREDLDCWLRCHEVLGYSIKVDHPMMGYRASPTQISGNKLKMLKRHYFVLNRYRFKNGRQLGLGAALFTATHFAVSVINRRAAL